MSEGLKIPIEKAMKVADRFLAIIQPYVTKIEVAGSVRRRAKTVGDIEFCCVENPFNALSNLFYKGYPGMVVDGARLKRFKYPASGIQIELYITSEIDYGRIFAIRTGSSAYSHIQLANTWWRLGWAGTIDGLRRRTECEHKGATWKIKPEYAANPTKPPPFITESDFFDFLGIPWIPPQERNWESKYQNLNYSK
jgi:DNA polymerase/3'-5' exonuclease PolX